MTSDSADLESNSALPDADSRSNVSDKESNSILPEVELNSVLQYLKSNSTPADAVSKPEKPDSQTNSAPADASSNPENPDLQINSNSKDAASNAAIPSLDSISALSDLNALDSPLPENKVKNNIQVQWKTEEGRLLLILPTEAQVPATEFSWYEIWQQMRQRLQTDRLRIPNTPVYLLAKDRLLDSRQLQELAEVLSEVQLQLKSVATSRRQTAIAAVSSGYSVEQLQPETSLSSEIKTTPTPLADALYLEMTVRSGVEIRHPGSVIILGDLNPGGIVVADGDILVWGRLRGVAHAGASGNRECLIMSLQMEPTQLRIADAVARAPEKSPTQFSPEVAHMTPQGIRIARAIDFSRNQLGRINQEP
ncbi:septum site-determining protein MinC [Nostoc sp. 106C]|uniref:septum site-determining protein MinC n=1 Tax=Nostoc sp. 106C TaxID=1932667 RepID=UPI000A3C18D2|nr:septum site-determining protein MinC [Nostoc sp. 106C]OUL18091.1 septum site-determining protein MinC [Nostoc sp. RF31YmG]OUL22262.1 septum site-determining protein MinC [Nostoc sp. 106C]